MGVIDWSSAAGAAGGHWHGTPPTGSMPAFSHDSRKLQPGEAFVALPAQRDGHDFIAAAAKAGASAALVERPLINGLPQLVVPNALEALGKLACSARRASRCICVAVTGSCGKTTVRAMIGEILAAAFGRDAVLASAGNFNNLIGLPLSLLRLESGHRYAVIEAGMNHPDELTDLAAIAEPDLSVVTNVGSAHRGNFTSPRQIAHAKGELLAGTSNAGSCIINFDDANADVLVAMAGGRRVLGFSLAGAAGAAVSLAPGEEFALQHDEGSTVAVKLQVPGKHNEENALAAAAVAWALGIENDAVAAGLAAYAGTPGRLFPLPARGGGVLIDDTYNASPESVRAALAVLAARPEPAKVLVLGDLLELGDDSEQLHSSIGKDARQQGITAIMSCGTLAAAAAASGDGQSFATKRELAEAAAKLAGQDTVFLIKGSRGSHMEEVVAALAEGS